MSTDSPVPPWVSAPGRTPDSLYWRMGAAEEVLERWLLFVLDLDDDTRAEYLKSVAVPAPWKDVVDMAVSDRIKLLRIISNQET